MSTAPPLGTGVELRALPGRLRGELEIGGAKACGPAVLGLALLHAAPLRCELLPASSDFAEACDALAAWGQASVELREDAIAVVASAGAGESAGRAEGPAVRSRTLLPLAGILATQRGEATLPAPRGCAIGPRPIDLHAAVLAEFGIELREHRETLRARRTRAVAHAAVTISRPSVGASIQALLTAAAASHPSVIAGVADATETRFLLAALERAGLVEAVAAERGRLTVAAAGGGAAGRIDPLTVPRDGIEIGSWLLAALLLGDELALPSAGGPELPALVGWLARRGAPVELAGARLRVRRWPRPFRLGSVDTAEGVHTDYLAPLAALGTAAETTTAFTDRVFPGRVSFLRELAQLAPGRRSLPARPPWPVAPGGVRFAQRRAWDIRCGFAQLMLGLAGEEPFTLTAIDVLERGYPAIEQKLTAAGIAVEVR